MLIVEFDGKFFGLPHPRSSLRTVTRPVRRSGRFAEALATPCAIRAS
jgi:hypothetical protein